MLRLLKELMSLLSDFMLTGNVINHGMYRSVQNKFAYKKLSFEKTHILWEEKIFPKFRQPSFLR